MLPINKSWYQLLWVLKFFNTNIFLYQLYLVPSFTKSLIPIIFASNICILLLVPITSPYFLQNNFNFCYKLWLTTKKKSWFPIISKIKIKYFLHYCNKFLLSLSSSKTFALWSLWIWTENGGIRSNWIILPINISSVEITNYLVTILIKG